MNFEHAHPNRIIHVSNKRNDYDNETFIHNSDYTHLGLYVGLLILTHPSIIILLIQSPMLMIDCAAQDKYPGFHAAKTGALQMKFGCLL